MGWQLDKPDLEVRGLFTRKKFNGRENILVTLSHWLIPGDFHKIDCHRFRVVFPAITFAGFLLCAVLPIVTHWKFCPVLCSREQLILTNRKYRWTKMLINFFVLLAFREHCTGSQRLNWWGLQYQILFRISTYARLLRFQFIRQWSFTTERLQIFSLNFRGGYV